MLDKMHRIDGEKLTSFILQCQVRQVPLASTLKV